MGPPQGAVVMKHNRPAMREADDAVTESRRNKKARRPNEKFGRRASTRN